MKAGVGVAVLFPGQGTQTPQMGEPWRAHASWSVVEAAESVIGEPVADLLLEADDEVLARTREAQLSVLLASLVAWDAVRDQIGTPLAFAGHSLGQVTALVASGMLDADTGVRLAAERAECTQAAADRHEGRMAALLGGSLEAAEAACDGDGCWIANDNAPGQVVVGGTPAGVAAMTGTAKAFGFKRAIDLAVGGAFHTPLMTDARDALLPTLEALSFAHGNAPVVSNVDAQPHTGESGWREQLADHLVRPVQWRRTMERLVALGATTFVEVGPGAVLTGLARRTVPQVHVLNVSVPDDLSSLGEVAQMEVA